MEVERKMHRGKRSPYLSHPKEQEKRDIPPDRVINERCRDEKIAEEEESLTERDSKRELAPE